MKFELVRATTPMGEYQGLLHKVDAKRIAIHVHGTWGNFYENSIATSMAGAYARRGISFASINIPGRDYESVHEHFAASHQVLEAWVDRLAPNLDELIWQGHSLGALKVVKHVVDGLGARPSALVLMSPFDIRSFNARSTDEVVIQQKFAQASVEPPDQLVDPTLFDVWPISNRTYADCLALDGHLALFPSGLDSVGALDELGVPALVYIGGEDFAQSPDPTTAAAVLGRARGVRTEFVPGAPHNFAGHESELVSRLEVFLDELS
jgi:pimeloyl-ACP methyl ester carboxylesterase